MLYKKNLSAHESERHINTFHVRHRWRHQHFGQASIVWCVCVQNRLPNNSCKLYSSEQTKYTPTILIIISHSTKPNQKKRKGRRRGKHQEQQQQQHLINNKNKSETAKWKRFEPRSRAPHVYNNSWISRLHKQQLILFTFSFFSSCIFLPPYSSSSCSSSLFFFFFFIRLLISFFHLKCVCARACAPFNLPSKRGSRVYKINCN